MSILSLNTETYEIEIEPEALTLAPFKKLHKLDRSKTKEKFKKQIGFVYYYCSVTSEFNYITDDAQKKRQIMLTVGLIKEADNTPPIGKELQEVIDFYKSFRTINEELYSGAFTAASVLNEQLKNAEDLLSQVDPKSGKPLYSLKDITTAIKDVPVIMKNLKAAEKELILEQKTSAGKMKGSQTYNLFEDGFAIQ